ncbi:hypothetical protein [Pediococcus pentosaceus]|uniref:hypothetical protein n=1 Tax=Pediococcus pentosaceus TaxID=1255 RepID=UPI0011B40B25|nr:hypothetical protein [Pediococcus pentosaceus]QDZ69517.1 hypothetical protein PSL001_00725 [Pediococcus pentosaceus]
MNWKNIATFISMVSGLIVIAKFGWDVLKSIYIALIKSVKWITKKVKHSDWYICITLKWKLCRNKKSPSVRQLRFYRNNPDKFSTKFQNKMNDGIRRGFGANRLNDDELKKRDEEIKKVKEEAEEMQERFNHINDLFH